MQMLEGFGLGGYRSFRNHVRIGPLAKVNLFVGGNNTGKSNILRFLRHHYQDAVGAITRNGEFKIDADLDRTLGSGKPVRFSLAFRAAQLDHFDQMAKASNRLGASQLQELFDQPALRFGTDLVWIDYQERGTNAGNLQLALPLDKLRSSIYSWDEWAQLLRRASGSGNHEDIKRVFQALSPLPPDLTPQLVPAIREITKNSPEADDFSGAGLVDRLAQLKDPRFGQEADRRRFDAITLFMQEVVGDESAELHIPFDHASLLVDMGGKRLPLESLGTGIQEVIILAAAGTILEGQLVCIEEPEIHLHPLLQRKLLRYLAQHTDNQYFIATHSSHLIDTPDAAVFHVTEKDGATQVRLALAPHERFAICQDLGYRASDLLQTNAVIWVEGPTERIYLTHWIRSQRPDLVEGLHYSIMWYGGRLLSHLTTEEVEEFLDLRRLNRHMVVLMDSDKSSRKTNLNATKTRITEEFDNSQHGFAWVTAGREIENYIPRPLLVKALKAVQPKHVELAGTGRYERAIPRPEDGYRYDKVRIAREVVKHPADLSQYDLAQRVAQLIAFIDEANGLATPLK